MARWYRAGGVVLGVLLGLCWANAALAQNCAASGLTVTSAGAASGFGVSTFACGFPNSSSNAATGPTGSVGTGSDDVLVVDGPANTTYSFNPQTCDGEAPGPGCNIASSTYLATTNGSTGSVTMGPITTATNSMQEWSVDTGNELLDHVPPADGTATTVNQSLGTLGANEIYAVATMPYKSANGSAFDPFPYAAAFNNPGQYNGANGCAGHGNISCFLAGDMLVLGNVSGSGNGPGIYDYRGIGSPTLVQADANPGLDALAVAYNNATSAANADATLYVGSATSASDAIEGFNAETGATGLTIAADVLCSDGTECLSSGVTGLYALQTGDLAGDLLAETATEVDLVCVAIGEGCASLGEIVPLATGGSGGGTIGADFNTTLFTGTNPNGCTNSGDDIYTCKETIYLSQATSLDQMTYGQGPLQLGVPEPTPLTLFGTGLVGLGILRRRKRA
jgi:hypothetical protein